MLKTVGVLATLGTVIYLAGALATKPLFRVADSMQPYMITTVRPMLIRRTSIKTYIVITIASFMLLAGSIGAAIAMIWR